MVFRGFKTRPSRNCLSFSSLSLSISTYSFQDISEESSSSKSRSNGSGMGASVSVMVDASEAVKDTEKNVYDWIRENNVELVEKYLQSGSVDSPDDDVSRKYISINGFLDSSFKVNFLTEFSIYGKCFFHHERRD